MYNIYNTNLILIEMGVCLVTLLNCEYHNWEHCSCNLTFAKVVIVKYIHLNIANVAIVKHIHLNIANITTYNTTYVKFCSFVMNCVTYCIHLF